MLKPRVGWQLADVGGLFELDRRSDESHPFSSTSRSHFRWADTFRARSLRVRFLRLSIGGWTWFCSFTDGLEACSKNWITSCTGDGSEERSQAKKRKENWSRQTCEAQRYQFSEYTYQNHDHAQTVVILSSYRPGLGFCKYFSNNSKSKMNSNQEVSGGVEGLLPVTASRSAASALIFLTCLSYHINSRLEMWK